MFNVCSIEDVKKAVKGELEFYTQNALKKALTDLRTQMCKDFCDDLEKLIKSHPSVTTAAGFGPASAGESVSAVPNGMTNVVPHRSSIQAGRPKNLRRPKRSSGLVHSMELEEDFWEEIEKRVSTGQSTQHLAREQSAEASNLGEAELILEASDALDDLNSSYVRLSFIDSTEDSTENVRLLSIDVKKTPVYDTCVHQCRKWVNYIVTHPFFEPFCGMLVLANAVFLGLYVSVLDPESEGCLAAELIFCIIFLTELLLRLFTSGPYKFYCGTSWKWAWFDTFIVSLQLIDQCEQFTVRLGSSNGNVSSLRVLRLLRILRLTRVLRLFPMLALVSNAMTASLSTTLYCFSVLALMVYGFSVVFAQALGHACETSEALDEYFGTLPRTGFTLFASITGGVEWEDVWIRIIEGSNPLMGHVFIAYLALISACGLSVALGIIIDSLTKLVREDKDFMMARRIHELFHGSENTHSEKQYLSWCDFAAKSEHPALQEYFKAIDVDATPEDAKYVFQLLDDEGRGSMSADQLVIGCLRLRGPARALDMQILLKETEALSRDVTQMLDHCAVMLAHIKATQVAADVTDIDDVPIKQEPSSASPKTPRRPGRTTRFEA